MHGKKALVKIILNEDYFQGYEGDVEKFRKKHLKELITNPTEHTHLRPSVTKEEMLGCRGGGTL